MSKRYVSEFANDIRDSLSEEDRSKVDKILKAYSNSLISTREAMISLMEILGRNQK